MYCGEAEACIHAFSSTKDKCVWIPKLSDPIQPERGLMGLVKNEPSLFYRFFDRLWICETYSNDHQRTGLFDGSTPEIAVAKAVIVQEERHADN